MLKRLSILAALSLAVFSGFAGTAFAGGPDFLGTWTISGSVKAPWEDPAHPMTTDDPGHYVGRVVEIAEGRMSGPGLIGCGATELTVESFPYAGLFEGGLGVEPGNPAAGSNESQAKRLAEGLGFTTEPVESLTHGCSELILHRLDDETLLFGLDNRIYTMKRR